jgi:hypothetical protein
MLAALSVVALLAVALVVTAIAPAADPAAATPARKVNVVVVTGGHGFEEKPFLEVFEKTEGIAFTHAPQKDHSELFEDISNWPYDVIVFYNMSQNISEKRQKNLIALLERGVGVVVTHHALAAFQAWPEFEKIAGGKFYLKDTEVDGVKHAQSTYKHGLDIPVHVEDAAHPITQGLKDFTIHDEAYGKYSVRPEVHVILTTTDPNCEKAVAWTGTYAKARTCYLLFGHDSKAYANPAYLTLMRQSILWVAGDKAK